MHDYRDADLEPRVRCLCDLAVKVTHESSRVTAADLEVLRSEGWSDAAIHDALQVIAYFNYINRIADAVGVEDEPEWAQPDRERTNTLSKRTSVPPFSE
jgi:uncharacterized peroxidase-related enzyme